MKSMTWMYGALEQVMLSLKKGYPDAFRHYGLSMPITLLSDGDDDYHVRQALDGALNEDLRIATELKEAKELSVHILYVASSSRHTAVTVSGTMIWEKVVPWILAQFEECKVAAFAVVVKPKTSSYAPDIWLFNTL
ncbi:MAG: hypothetical protein J6M02_06155 [Clostridia bacterium]|nr:hypothetical protein [Clostridia bacterium]